MNKINLARFMPNIIYIMYIACILRITIKVRIPTGKTCV